MADRTDLFCIHTKPFWLTLTKYREPLWGIRRLSFPSKDRWAVDCGLISLIFEFWGWRLLHRKNSMCVKRPKPEPKPGDKK